MHRLCTICHEKDLARAIGNHRLTAKTNEERRDRNRVLREWRKPSWAL